MRHAPFFSWCHLRKGSAVSVAFDYACWHRAVLVAIASLCVGSVYAQASAKRSAYVRVRARHQLACGVVQEDAEYSTAEDHASRGAFDERVCQAVAAASAPGVRVASTSFLDEMSAAAALRAHRVDVIATLSADRTHVYPGIRLSPPVFWDGLALLVPTAQGAKQPSDLAGKKICVLAETGNEEALRSWFAQHHIDYLPFPFQEEGEMEAAYATGNCAALAAQRTRLAVVQASFGSAASAHVILPQGLSQDPMAIATAPGDLTWSSLVDGVARSLLATPRDGGALPATRSSPQSPAPISQ